MGSLPSYTVAEAKKMAIGIAVMASILFIINCIALATARGPVSAKLIPFFSLLMHLIMVILAGIIANQTVESFGSVKRQEEEQYIQNVQNKQNTQVVEASDELDYEL
jgi:uncharacterized membrane protein YdbT with pleckstrin-like domain